ncbi:MAG: twin-arginine translocase TatA/TatE family subunit [bacterium]|nr:twin-arginine translocase TatA/TatE family subunit [bacterium]
MSIGSAELLLVLVVILLLFGGKRLPEIARNLGQGLAGFRRAVQDIQPDIQYPVDTPDSARHADDVKSDSETKPSLVALPQNASESQKSPESPRSHS